MGQAMKGGETCKEPAEGIQVGDGGFLKEDTIVGMEGIKWVCERVKS